MECARRFTAAGHGRSRTPARGAVALPGRAQRARRKAEIGGRRRRNGTAFNAKAGVFTAETQRAQRGIRGTENSETGTRPLDHALRRAQGREHGRTARAALRFSKGGNRKRDGETAQPSPQRAQRTQRKTGMGGTAKTARPSPQRTRRTQRKTEIGGRRRRNGTAVHRRDRGERRGGRGGKKVQNAECPSRASGQARRDYAVTSRRGRGGDGKAAFATCSLKPHASSLPLCGEKQEGGRVRELGNRSPAPRPCPSTGSGP